MDRDYSVLVVDESAHESTLVASVIALERPTLHVRAVPNTQAAREYLRDGAAARQLVILGPRALSDAETAMALLDGRRPHISVIGLAPGVSAATKERALRAGVLAVHERPAGWPEYRDLVSSLLEDWLD